MKAVRAAFVAGLSAAERNMLETMLADRIAGHLSGVGRVASYSAFGGEISPAQLSIGAMLLPRVAGLGLPLTFHDPGAASLVRSRFGVAEPPAGLPDIDPDILLIPLLGIDRCGNRIGYGAGHYDRTLAALRQRRSIFAIGCAWDCQLIDSVPPDVWDQSLDAFATPTQFTFVTSR